MRTMYNLSAQYDARRDFYGKATVSIGDDGNKILTSYNTRVAEVRDGKAKVFGTYSATTLRHIKEFLKQEGFRADTKTQIENDYMEV